MKWLLGISLAFALAAGGCDNGDDGDSAPRTTVAPATSTTTTTPADPYAVPATIDEAYVQRVVQKLYDIETMAVRVIVNEQELVPEAVEILRSVFLVEELNAQLEGWGDLIAEGELALFRDRPDPVAIQEVEVLRATNDCVQARTVEDPTPAARQPIPALESFLTLRPKAASPDPRALNPTPWKIARESTTAEGTGCDG